MKTCGVCRPVRQGPATGEGSTPSTGKTLPNDLLQEASFRLGIMAALGAVLWLVATFLYHLAASTQEPAADTSWMRPRATDGISAAAIVASLGLFYYTRRTDRDPKFILDLGLVYLVLTALALGFVTHWDPVNHMTDVVPTITWTGAVLLMFAAIVPCAPSKMLAAGLIAVCMNPIAMLVAKARGAWDFGPSVNVLVMHYPDFLLAGVAVLISQVVMRLGHQINKERELGSYKLISLLGKGGMGEVWLARHGMLAREAAVKLIRPSLLNSGASKNAMVAQRRFEQEAKATAVLRSPHTINLYDFGVTEDGVFYYVMELLDGMNLETLVKTYGPQPAGRVATILQQVCRSLEEAHQRGLIHRDIKPSNIFLCRMGGEYDYAKVLDFGLVKVVDDADMELTGEGATTGTPAYMAPEIALNQPIDGRADLYSLGCVGYWLATGQMVFQEKGATAMMFAHIRDTPMKPSERSELPVPEWLDRTLLLCLEKEREKRPASADSLRQMLEAPGRAGSWTAKEAENWWNMHQPEDRGKAESFDAAGETVI